MTDPNTGPDIFARFVAEQADANLRATHSDEVMEARQALLDTDVPQDPGKPRPEDAGKSLDQLRAEFADSFKTPEYQARYGITPADRTYHPELFKDDE